MTTIWRLLGFGGGLFLGMILHEYVHARVALAMGDRSGKAYGRVTPNPKAHIDPVGTVVIPALFLIPILVGHPITGFIFGYAKPVPVNYGTWRGQKRAPLIVAAAGPATNFAIALLAGLALKATIGSGAAIPGYTIALAGILTVNCFLAVINALPIPPLDGSRALGLFLSPQAAHRMEELGQYFLLFLVALFLFFSRVIPALVDPVCRAASFGSLIGCPL
ncbi:MAG: site-2 protease family protein [Actinomycetota bacterium]|nr:site-2 protease family protein [Actinomycetota bacterium]